MRPLVNVYRGGRLESSHSGSIAVVDSTGQLLAYAGDPGTTTFFRSAAKPFQAFPLIERDGIERFGLTSKELALVCASHGGEPDHVATAASILAKGGFKEDDLLCGRHDPYTRGATRQLRDSGAHPTELHNNCSGKHGGMLLLSRLMDVSHENYIETDHPVQVEIKSAVARAAGVPAETIQTSIDGCGVPSYFLSLHRAALAYARLGSAAAGLKASVHEELGSASKQVWDAMTSHPESVAGAWSLTTPLIEAGRGALLAKEGAEGFYSMALSGIASSPVLARLGLPSDRAIGIALKVADGSMGRGRDPVILRVLDLLGFSLASSEGLDRIRQKRTMTNVAGKPVGEIIAEFDLTFL